jgi:hypothetical protein
MLRVEEEASGGYFFSGTLIPHGTWMDGSDSYELMLWISDDFKTVTRAVSRGHFENEIDPNSDIGHRYDEHDLF